MEAYNDLLARAQDEFPDNDLIQSLEKAQTSSRLQQNAAAIQRVRSRVSHLADALDIDFTDLEDARGGELRPINPTVSQEADLNQQQAQSQAQQLEQYVDVDILLDDVDRATMPPDEKEALKEMIREFESELEGSATWGGSGSYCSGRRSMRMISVLT